MKYVYPPSMAILLIIILLSFCAQSSQSHEQLTKFSTTLPDVIEDYTPATIQQPLAAPLSVEKSTSEQNLFSKLMKETKKNNKHFEQKIQSLESENQRQQQAINSLEKLIDYQLKNGAYGAAKRIDLNNALIFSVAAGFSIVLYSRLFPGGSFIWEVMSTSFTVYWMIKFFQQNASIFAQAPQFHANPSPAQQKK